MKDKISAWFIELRAKFLMITIFPVIAGALLAKKKMGIFYPGYFFMAMVGAVFFHLGTNIINDYFDHLNGADAANNEYWPGFSGGSRMIQEGRLAPGEVMAGAVMFFALGAAAGVYLAFKIGVVILIPGVIGLLAAVFYSYFKNSFYLGEILVGLCFGFLLTFGSYYAQARVISLDVVLMSVPFAVLTILILWINEFPDHESDLKSGKKTMVVRLGKKAASHVYIFMVIFTYLYVAFLGIFYRMPMLLIALATLPLAYRNIRTIYKSYNDNNKLMSLSGLTAGLYASIGSAILMGLLWMD